MARRRFFVDAVRGGRAQIAGDDAHHLTRVLRVEPGQKFEISDNENVYLAEVQAAHKRLVEFAVLERLPAAPARVEMRLLASLVRFERFELMIEKATELGVSAIWPVLAERSEKGLERAAGKRAARWNRIAREASEQARRARLPEISPPVRFAEALKDASTHRYALEEAGAPAMLAALPERRDAGDRVALLVGPEGGWSDRERAGIAVANWRPVSLGRNILKADTAALAALAIVGAAWEAP